MARVSLSLTVLSNGDLDALASTSMIANQAAAATSVATLVTDGATPTQAHVTAHNTNWSALNIDLNRHVSLVYDTSSVTSLNTLRKAVDALIRMAQGRGEIK